MFPSFTGSTRPRRQVNLSGRSSNPFAAVPGSRTSSAPQAQQNALVLAQQERILRQQERERPPAANKIQSTWRGYKERTEVQGQWRRQWDLMENWRHLDVSKEVIQSYAQSGPAPTAYGSEEECLSSLRLLVQFASPRNHDDMERLHHFAARYIRYIPRQTLSPAEKSTNLLLRLARLTIGALSMKPFPSLSPYALDSLLALLQTLAARIPNQLAQYSQDYFKTLGELATSQRSGDRDLLVATVVSLLQPITPRVDMVYEGFASEFLTVHDLPTALGSFEIFARCVKYEFLTAAIGKLLFPISNADIIQSKSRESLLWLLAHYIYIRRSAILEQTKTRTLPEALYIKIISKLISFLADDIGDRMDASVSSSSIVTKMSSSSMLSPKSLPAFVRSEILTLINQENVSSLLANIDIVPDPEDGATGSSNEAAALASYALTLLRAFPRRGDEIRMWLYRGSTSRQSQTARGGKTLPAIKYFYRAARSTKVFEYISKDPRDTVSMLRPDKSQTSSTKPSFSITNESRNQQWRVILLFLELYTFVLKVMDDEEFLSGTVESNPDWSWTRQSALPLDQVSDLTIFLKKLAFAMYWYASDIAGIEATETKTSLAEYFGSTRSAQTIKIQDESPAKFGDMSVAGVSGMTLAYMKGMVTGVLRMVYERE